MGRLALKVIPGSKKPKIEFLTEQGDKNSQRPGMANEPKIVVRLCEPADKNKANIALIKLLSNISGFQVRICAGASSRIKVIEFGTDAQTFLKQLREGNIA
jgi:uncharacterized protein YggU (UPF0235/DUF167 family)